MVRVSMLTIVSSMALGAWLMPLPLASVSSLPTVSRGSEPGPHMYYYYRFGEPGDCGGTPCDVLPTDPVLDEVCTANEGVISLEDNTEIFSGSQTTTSTPGNIVSAAQMNAELAAVSAVGGVAGYSFGVTVAGAISSGLPVAAPVWTYYAAIGAMAVAPYAGAALFAGGAVY